MSIGGSSRAASPRAHNRPRSWRAIGYAIALGILIVVLGTQPHGQAPSRTGPRLSVTVADAATNTHGKMQELGRETTARGGAVAPSPDPIFAAATPADVPPELLFDPSSLIASTPKPAAEPRIDMSEMVLRSDTITPSEPISGEPSRPDASATTAALPEPPLPAAARAEATAERSSAPRLAGTWAADRAACSRRNSGYLPMVIDEKGARAGTSSCRFDRARQTGNRWAIAATCRNGQETWSANVKLVLDGARLTWSSERGTERYQRCR